MRRLGSGALALWLAAAVPGAASSQDIELAAQMFGRPLPRGYYELIRRQPDFFTLSRGWIQRSESARSAGAAVAGKLPLVVVLGLFADSPEPPFSASDIERAYFTGPAQYGTIPELYSEMSLGKLQVAGTVLPWVRSSLTAAEVSGNSAGLGGDAKLGQFLLEILALADPAVDFGLFDNDGPDGVPNSGDDDGFVDAVVFQYLERGAHCGGVGPWPHRSRLENRTGAPFATNDPRPGGGVVMVNDYIMLSTVGCEGEGIGPISVLAHEIGHVLGLPDLYDTSLGSQPEQRIWIIGCWALMSGGGWGCGDAAARTVVDRPPHMGAWEKSELGWITPVEVGAGINQVLTLAPVRSSGRVLRVPLSGREWLLVEYRDKKGFDRDLPLPGILVYHVDLDQPFRRCSTCDRFFRVMLVEADGNGRLLQNALEGGNRGEPGDVFGLDGRTRLTNRGASSTRLNSGLPSSVTFYELVVEDSVARVRLSTVDLDRDRLLAKFLTGNDAALTSEEAAYLDGEGNRNGRYDLGDLRQYLLEHPRVLR
ncbi:MAG: hypothetical protein KatS3mg081_2130 [Gemmatimonadales bacterium]|nr:MAG: hypothetical protein KatS3mg081_2130 [Gemmatimonadales bacterium]